MPVPIHIKKKKKLHTNGMHEAWKKCMQFFRHFLAKNAMQNLSVKEALGNENIFEKNSRISNTA